MEAGVKPRGRNGGAPLGNKNRAKPGPVARVSLRYKAEETALLLKAWEYDIKHDPKKRTFQEWLNGLCRDVPINEAKRIIAWAEEWKEDQEMMRVVLEGGNE